MSSKNPFDVSNLIKGVAQAKAAVGKIEQELANIEVVGESGAGFVKVVADGRYTVKNVEIDPEILKEPKAILEELLTTAINNAMRKAEAVANAKAASMGALFREQPEENDTE